MPSLEQPERKDVYMHIDKTNKLIVVFSEFVTFAYY
jgi:hypothetical protein